LRYVLNYAFDEVEGVVSLGLLPALGTGCDDEPRSQDE